MKPPAVKTKVRSTRVRAGGRTFIIEGWHQPEGHGGGWAPCSDRQAETFYVFDAANGGQRCMRQFKTRAEAATFLEGGGDPH